MHLSAYYRIQTFLDAYTAPGGTVLDVGSATLGEQRNAREICKEAGLAYSGLDIAAGNNVDIVLARPFVWDEIVTESYDYVISTSSFEHNPFFWSTFAEMARALKQDGKMMVTAPSAGHVHRHPLDCWRFYLDSWGVLCTMTGMTPLEVVIEPEERNAIPGAQWQDTSLVAAKPVLSDEEAPAFYARLAEIVAPYTRFGLDFPRMTPNAGPAAERYLAKVREAGEERRRRRLARKETLN
jgi:SAM-dependent methyltransferase